MTSSIRRNFDFNDSRERRYAMRMLLVTLIFKFNP